jgi:hypothetical protein
MRHTVRALALVASVSLLASACGDDSGGSGAAASGGEALTGLLRLAPGACDAGGVPAGSWFKMVQPNGTVDTGPYVANPDSACAGQAVTVLSPGSDGGLRAGAHQPQPEPNFTDTGGSASAAVIQPALFFAVPFGISTNETDPQTGERVPAPNVRADGTDLSADLSSISVSWNGQHFNQGAPKPGDDGAGAAGTFDPATGAYTLDWTSEIDGGPFDGFTGVWHLEGTFEPAG